MDHQLTGSSLRCYKKIGEKKSNMDPSILDHVACTSKHAFKTAAESLCPMLPYIYDDIKELVRNVLQLVVKYEVIEKCKTPSAYQQIDLPGKSNILSKSKFNIGRAADITIAEMKQKDMVTKYQLDTFKQVCLLFPLATTRTLLDKTKLGSFIMHYASCRNPSHLTNLASSSEFFKLVINLLVYLKILPAKTGDKALRQFSGFILNYVKEEPGKITSFNPKK